MNPLDKSLKFSGTQFPVDRSCTSELWTKVTMRKEAIIPSL